MPAKRRNAVATVEQSPPPLAGAPVKLRMTADPSADQRYVALAPVFRALGDPIRLRLVSLIAAHPGGEACVCELTGPFDVTQPAISHHLRVLREAGLVTSERRGTWVYYRVPPEWIRLLDTFRQQSVQP
jgi:ArsR family transcriptional regulator